MKPDTILSAIELTTSYLLGHIDASTIFLPLDPLLRRPIVEPKVREILNASLEFVFSDERLRDGSHTDGLKMQRLFEDLVGTCVRACVALGDIEWLFEELYERYEANGIEGIFLKKIEPWVLGGEVHALPPSVSQRLISIHEERGEFEDAQRIIWHVDPEWLDINQVLGLCQRRRLYDALIYVYNRTMKDYVSPLVELMGLVRNIMQHRQQRFQRNQSEMEISFDEHDPSEFRGAVEEDIEASVQDAYKVYAYLAQAFAGLSYPSRTPLSYEEATAGRTSLYRFLFASKSMKWPSKGGNKVLTTIADGEAEPSYPYLRLLLRFDAEAMLDALDLAFEESFLELEDDQPRQSLDRQDIINILINVLSIESDFSNNDLTFLYIFIARNLPKYPQYIQLSPSILHQILIGLITDDDQSTIEDRQLATEYLLSTYTPHDGPSMIILFEQAGFFRILRSIYQGERRWAALASTYLRDPDISDEIFSVLRETLALAKLVGRLSDTSDAERTKLDDTILDAIPTLIQAGGNGLQETAELMDDFIPTRHSEVIQRLVSTPWRQFAYLRFLLEPVNESDLAMDRQASTHLDSNQRLLYLSLLCTHESSHLIAYLEAAAAERDGLGDMEEAIQIFEDKECYDALIWSLDRKGEVEEAFSTMKDTLDTRVDLLVNEILNGSTKRRLSRLEEEEGNQTTPFQSSQLELYLEQVSSIAEVSTVICSRITAEQGSSSLTPEDLWFQLLSSLVSTVGSIRAACPAAPPLLPLVPTRLQLQHTEPRRRRNSTESIIYNDNDEEEMDSIPQPLLSPRSTELLSSLIPNALSSLISTTSSRTVSFPTLMRRLIDSRSSSSSSSTQSYASEFKSIITSMLNSYIFSGDLLTLASNIVDQDLFEFVQVLKEGKLRGWRAGTSIASGHGLCQECKRIVWSDSEDLVRSKGSHQEINGDFINNYHTGDGSSPMSRGASFELIESLGLNGRPRMGKRPSIKGKEVQWTDQSSEMMNQGSRSQQSFEFYESPKGVVISSGGEVWHEKCYLKRR
jgi:hypothetical protein